MANYNYQQIIDELKSLFVQVRANKAQARIAQRLVNSADSFRTRKSIEISNLESKINLITPQMLTQIESSRATVDAIKRDAFDNGLAEIKAKLEALQSHKDSLAAKTYIDSTEYPAPTINELPTINLLIGMIETIILSTESSFNDTFNGGKYEQIKTAVEDSEENDAPDSDVLTQMFEKMSYLNARISNLSDKVNAFMNTHKTTSADNREEFDTLCEVLKGLEVKKNELALALTNGTQTEIDNAQTALDVHRQLMLDQANVAQVKSVEFDADIFAKNADVKKAFAAVIRAKNDAYSFYQSNSNSLSDSFGISIDDDIEYSLTQAFRPVFESLTTVANSAPIGLSDQYLEFYNSLNDIKSNHILHNKMNQKYTRLRNYTPFVSTPDGDIEWDNQFNRQERVQLGDQFHQFRNIFNGVIESIGAMMAIPSNISYYESEFNSLLYSANQLAPDFKFSLEAYLNSEIEYNALSAGWFGSDPAAKEAWMNEKRAVANYTATHQESIRKADIAAAELSFAMTKYPEYFASYEPLSITLSNAQVAYENYVAAGDTDPGVVSAAYDVMFAAQSAIADLNSQYPTAANARLNRDLRNEEQNNFQNALTQANLSLSALEGTLTLVESSDFDKQDAHKQLLTKSNLDDKTAIIYQKIAYSIQMMNIILPRLASMYTQQAAGFQQNIDAAWELAKNTFAGSNMVMDEYEMKRDAVKRDWKNDMLTNLQLTAQRLAGSETNTFWNLVKPGFSIDTFPIDNFSNSMYTFAQQSLHKGSLPIKASEVITKSNNG